MISIARGPIRWILRAAGFAGVTLPPAGIYILEECLTDEGLIKHEKVHWAQYQRMGFFRFYATYVWQVLRYGYHNAPMEVEARQK